MQGIQHCNHQILYVLNTLNSPVEFPIVVNFVYRLKAIANCIILYCLRYIFHLIKYQISLWTGHPHTLWEIVWEFFFRVCRLRWKWIDLIYVGSSTHFKLSESTSIFNWILSWAVIGVVFAMKYIVWKWRSMHFELTHSLCI